MFKKSVLIFALLAGCTHFFSMSMTGQVDTTQIPKIHDEDSNSDLDSSKNDEQRNLKTRLHKKKSNNSRLVLSGLGLAGIAGGLWFLKGSSFTSSTPVTSLTSRSQFFRDIVGVEEALFGLTPINPVNIELIRSSIVQKGEDFFIRNNLNKNEFCCGDYCKMSLQALRDRVHIIPKPGPNTFSVIEAGDKNPETLRFVDIGTLQADPQNNGAVFQVASNFNALETVSANDAIPNIGKYVNDKTQGPFASISAAPGLIFRHYYCYYRERKNYAPSFLAPTMWPQRPEVAEQGVKSCDEKQINLLERLGVTTRNGYVVAGVENLTNFEANSGNFNVLYHHNIQVTFGRVIGENHEVCCNPNQRIDQIFTAALCLNAMGGTVAPGVTLDHANFVLQCDYEATLRAAALYGRRDINGRVRVFLTRMGGGAFGNPQNMIDEAIIRAVNIPDLQNAGLDIILNNYSTINYQQRGSSQALVDLVKKYNGSYNVYTNGKPQNIA